MPEKSVKIFHAALDELEGGEIILRGVIDPESLADLRVDHYQREVLPAAKIDHIVEGFISGTIPDIELGMRGQRCREREGAFFLQDPVYIVDGLQRVTAAIKVLKGDSGVTPRLGAAIRFGTNEKWERDRFRILNLDRTKLSPNVLLRNLREENEAIKLIYRLTVETSEDEFVLGKRVSWSQYQKRNELLTALSFCKMAGLLHGHISPGRASNLVDLSGQLERMMKKVGKVQFRENIKRFFQMVDAAWGLRRVAFREGAVHLRLTFLSTVAILLSAHRDFWRGKEEQELFVEASIIRKLAQFPLNDPQVVGLSSQGGKSNEILYLLLLKHVNSGKRTKRLKPWVRSDEPIELPDSFENSPGGENGNGEE